MGKDTGIGNCNLYCWSLIQVCEHREDTLSLFGKPSPLVKYYDNLNELDDKLYLASWAFVLPKAIVMPVIFW